MKKLLLISLTFSFSLAVKADSVSDMLTKTGTAVVCVQQVETASKGRWEGNKIEELQAALNNKVLEIAASTAVEVVSVSTQTVGELPYAGRMNLHACAVIKKSK